MAPSRESNDTPPGEAAFDAGVSGLCSVLVLDAGFGILKLNLGGARVDESEAVLDADVALEPAG